MITDVSGIKVGHWTDEVAMTGCTVVLCPPETVGSGEVRGGAPGTRETDLLRPGMLVNWVDAVMLSGGSAFGLAAADGVMKWLAERDRGFDTGVARVPIVPSAVIFDLAVGDGSVRPGPDQGYAACDAASEVMLVGAVGAGAGATVAKVHGPTRAQRGGLGGASVEVEGIIVAALAVVNALGEIVDDEGEVLLGTLPGEDGGESEIFPGNTTLVVVATNAKLSKERANLLAIAGHEGIDAAIRPSHTMWDGDTVFALATGQVEGSQAVVEEMAIEAVARAIRNVAGGGEG
jgi:L-aminopeptidase/D-esterase-like protein